MSDQLWVAEYFNCEKTTKCFHATRLDALEESYAWLFHEKNRTALTEDVLGEKVWTTLESNDYWELYSGGDHIFLRLATQEECEEQRGTGKK